MDCPRCKTAIIKDPYRGAEPNQRRHPVLERIKHAAGVEIEHCPACGGIYLDHRELETIQIKAREYTSRYQAPPAEQRVWARAHAQARPFLASDQAEEPKPLLCPACGGEMAERDWGFSSEVTIDTCLECRGVWLDFGELEALEEVFR